MWSAVATVAILLPLADTFVVPGRASASLTSLGAQANQYRCFVGNVPFAADEDAIRSALERFGAVVDCKLARIEQSKRGTTRQTAHRGFGKATFADTASAQAAVAASGELRVMGRALTIELEKRGDDGFKMTRHAFNAVLAACEKRGQPARALALYEAIPEHIEPDDCTLRTVMQAAAAAGELDVGFELLEKAADIGMRGDGAYSLHVILLEACRAAGQTERAARVQELIDSLGLKSVRPRASVWLDGQLHHVDYGNPGVEEGRLHALFNGARLRAGYMPRVDSLPHGFATSDFSEEQQHAALRRHPEKKALAELLRRKVQGDLSIDVNIKLCADCHEFFKAAAKLLGRTIRVNEPRLTHVFGGGDGECSCNDEWCWQSRLSHATATNGRGAEQLFEPSGADRTALLRGLRAARDSKEVTRWVDYLGKLTNAKEYAMTMSALVRCGDGARAIALLDEMNQPGAPQPDVVCYNVALAACSNLPSTDAAAAALNLLRTMPRANFTPDVVSFSSAISACAKSGRWRAALELLDEMQVAGIAPNEVSFNAAMQAVCSARQLEQGLRLLERADEAGLANSSFLLHRTLLDASLAAGNMSLADAVQARMHKHQLTGLAPEATAMIDGSLTSFVNGDIRSSLAVQAYALCDRVQQQTSYRPQRRALPPDFRRHTTHAQQDAWLRLHAEKKALAELVARGADRLETSINFKMCADCHALFKGASELLGRRIVLHEPKLTHVFNGGRCSCGDSWRHEEARRSSGRYAKMEGVLKRRRAGGD